jgi:hypothetical protein
MPDSSSTWLQKIQSAWLELPVSLRAFVLLDAALWTVNLLCIAICRRLHYGLPYNNFLLDEHFGDLLALRPRFSEIHTMAFFTDRRSYPFMYPAPVALLYSFFFLFGGHALAVYLTLGLGAAAFATYLLFRALHRRGLSSLSAFMLSAFLLMSSYPLMFTLKQANQELIIWIFMMSGLYAIFHRRDNLAGACFGVAIAAKIFPFIYLGLFLARRRIQPILIAACTAVVVTLASLFLIYPNLVVAWRLNNKGLAQFRPLVILRNYPQRNFDHSLFGLIKAALHPLPPTQTLAHILTAYLAMMAVLGLILYVVRIRKLPLINQVLALTIASIWFTPTSFDYTLLHLYVPWALLAFFALQHREHPPRSLLWAMLAMAVLMSPQSEIIHHGMGFGGQCKALILGALLVLSLVTRFRMPEDPASATPGAA